MAGQQRGLKDAHQARSNQRKRRNKKEHWTTRVKRMDSRLGRTQYYRNSYKTHMKRAQKEGLVPHWKYPDGKTPRVMNTILKRRAARESQQVQKKIDRIQFQIQRENDYRTEYQRIIDETEQYAKVLYKDKLAAEIDTIRFLQAEQRMNNYLKDRQTVYKAYVKDFIRNVQKDVQVAKRQAFFVSSMKNATISIQEQKQQRFDTKLALVQSIAVRNKLLKKIQQSVKFPSHDIISLPLLTPTMSEGEVVSWQKKIGDEINFGDVLCFVKTNNGGIDAVEAQERGFLARILVPEANRHKTNLHQNNNQNFNNNNNNNNNTNNNIKTNNHIGTSSIARLGQPLAIVVQSPKDIPRFLSLKLGNEPDEITNNTNSINRVQFFNQTIMKLATTNRTNNDDNISDTSTNSNQTNESTNFVDPSLQQLMNEYDDGSTPQQLKSTSTLNQDQSTRKSTTSPKSTTKPPFHTQMKNFYHRLKNIQTQFNTYANDINSTFHLNGDNLTNNSPSQQQANNISTNQSQEPNYPRDDINQTKLPLYSQQFLDFTNQLLSQRQQQRQQKSTSKKSTQSTTNNKQRQSRINLSSFRSVQRPIQIPIPDQDVFNLITNSTSNTYTSTTTNNTTYNFNFSTTSSSKTSSIPGGKSSKTSSIPGGKSIYVNTIKPHITTISSQLQQSTLQRPSFKKFNKLNLNLPFNLDQPFDPTRTVIEDSHNERFFYDELHDVEIDEFREEEEEDEEDENKKEKDKKGQGKHSHQDKTQLTNA